MIFKKVLSILNNKIWFGFILCVLFRQECTYCQEEEQQGSIIVNLIYGIGIPWDVQGGYMTTGYVVRVPYLFPMKIKEWKSPFAKYFEKRSANETITFPNKRRRKMLGKKTKAKLFPHKKLKSKKTDFNRDHYRWAIYRALEAYSIRLGFEGRICVLRSICEASEVPFDRDFDFIGEVMHLIFTPSSSHEPVSKHSDYEYHYAERVGKMGAPCDRIFKECKRSLLNSFSVFHSENLPYFM